MKCDCDFVLNDVECPSCAKEAAYLCERDGETVALCTRCTLGGDVKVARLFDEADIPKLIELDAGKNINEAGETFDSILDLFGGVGTLLRMELDKLPRAESKQ